MQSFLINNKAIPLASFQFLNTRTLIEAEQALASAVEPRRFSTGSKSHKQGMQVTRYQLADIQIYGLHFEGPLTISSEQLQSVNIIFPISGTLRTPIEKQDTQISCGHAKVDSPGDRVAVEWDTSSTSMVTRIPIATLNHFCHKLYDIDSHEKIRFAPIMDLSQYPGASLHNILTTILMEADNQDSLLNRGVLTQQFQELLVTSLLNGQSNSLSDIMRRRIYQVRPFYIKRAAEYIHENIKEIITLSDLVDASGVSLRTLQAGFSKHYNMGPSAYIKQLKMRKAREELLVANHLETTVADVAAKWGFYNPCNFTLNYKKQFGENPSATLQK